MQPSLEQAVDWEEPEEAPLPSEILPDVLRVEENPAPDTIPAPAPHHEFTEAHGYPSLRRVQPRE